MNLNSLLLKNKVLINHAVPVELELLLYTYLTTIYFSFVS